MAANLLLVDDDLGAIQLMGQLLLVRVGSQLRRKRTADALRINAGTGIANRSRFDDTLQRAGSQVVALSPGGE